MKKIILLLIVLISGVSSVSAQNLRSIYFSKKNPHRHEINPSFTPGKGYLTMPVLGNINVGVQSDFKLSSIFYPAADGSLDTFLSPNVTSEQLKANLDGTTDINAYINMDILSMGYVKEDKFTTISVNASGNVSAVLANDLFMFLKSGMSTTGDNRYSFGDFGANGQAMVEFAVGHSREILIPNLRVGVKAKVLVGILNVNLDYSKFDVALSQDRWMIDSEGYLKISGAVPTYDDNNVINGTRSYYPKLSGYGFAFDIGASYKLFGLEVSASVIDLGFMTWNDVYEAKTAGEAYEFTGFSDLDILNPSATSFDDQIDQMVEDAGDALMNFYEYKSGVKRDASTNPMVNIGAQYGIFNDLLQVGALFTSQFSDMYNWTDIMFSVNFRPVSWFNLGVNASTSNMGETFGALVDFNFKGLNLFCGVNVMSLEFSGGEVKLPINGSTVQLNTGLTFMF